jgi:hypothetical protein
LLIPPAPGLSRPWCALRGRAQRLCVQRVAGDVVPRDQGAGRGERDLNHPLCYVHGDEIHLPGASSGYTDPGTLLTPQQITQNRDLPVAAFCEALAYCQNQRRSVPRRTPSARGLKRRDTLSRTPLCGRAKAICYTQALTRLQDGACRSNAMPPTTRDLVKYSYGEAA